jgi:hypothetical protein
MDPSPKESKDKKNLEKFFDKTIALLIRLGEQKISLHSVDEGINLWIKSVKFTIRDFEQIFVASLDKDYFMRKKTILSEIFKIQGDLKNHATKMLDLRGLMEQKKIKLNQLRNEFYKKKNIIDMEHEKTIKKIKDEISVLEQEYSTIQNLKSGFFRKVSKGEKNRRLVEMQGKLEVKDNQLKKSKTDFYKKTRTLEASYSNPIFLLSSEITNMEGEFTRLEQIVNDSEILGKHRFHTSQRLMELITDLVHRKGIF